MSEIALPTENKTAHLKFYSSKSIWGATFLGGPLAGAYMMSENYNALGETEKGLKSLLLGIGATIILFTALFMLPESVVDNIPRQLIPFVYTVIIWAIVDKKQGDVLKLHKEAGNKFYSGWRAAGIGLISCVLLLAGIFAYAYLAPEDETYLAYDAQLEQFYKNEASSLEFYNHLDLKLREDLLTELDNDVLPLWVENLRILDAIGNSEDLPSELQKHNALLKEYSQLRIQGFELLRKAIDEDSYAYAEEIDQVHENINAVLEKLSSAWTYMTP